MTTLCLTLLYHDEPLALENHRHYCARMGYQHHSVSLFGLDHGPHRILFRLELILHHLTKLPNDGLLVCFSDDCVVYGMHPVEEIAASRDHVLPSIWSSDGQGVHLHQLALQIWRNNISVRDMLLGLITNAKVNFNITDELSLYRAFEYLEPVANVGGYYCAIGCNSRGAPHWNHPAVWCLILDDIPGYGGVPSLLRRTVFEHINDHTQKGIPLFAFPAYAMLDEASYKVINPGGTTALLTCYTPNIANYGAIAEANLTRYCLRHGYTLHVYRQLPQDSPVQTSANWLKPWLIEKHLPDHQWLLWTDADVLFINQSQPLGKLLEERNILVAHDIGNWLINSGIVGFRNTEDNLALVRAIWQRIVSVKDKSDVYASGGDQSVFCETLIAERNWKLDSVVDCITLNTPWYFQQDNSLCVHFLGIANEMRALLMATQDRHSMQLATANLPS